MAPARVVVLAVLFGSVAGAAGVASSPPGQRSAAPAVRQTIDGLVGTGLARLGLPPGSRVDDAVFLRRVYLDAIGTLPTAAAARAFLADASPGKRATLIDDLLARDEFADYWAMKWSDLLRVKSEFPINLWPNAVQAYYAWIRARVRDNTPYDRFARALLTSSGSNFRVPPVNFYRAVQSREPDALAQAVALTFMGVRAERWPSDRRAGMAAFFEHVGYKTTREWKEEIVFFNPEGPEARAVPVVLPDGSTISWPADRDPREVFADWLITPANPWFTKNIVNRVWSWLMGRGLIHEPDDIRPDNPASDPDLLALLERELVGADYDLRHLFRLILNSNAYQTAPGESGNAALGPSALQYQMRPLDAEVLIDAICQITGTDEPYLSPIPEPYTFTPVGQRAIALADGSMTSAFLETFGRPPRDTGLESERNARPTAAERLHLLNSSHIQRKIEQSRTLQTLVQGGADVRASITSLYLTILSRWPTDEEMTAALAHVKSAGTRRAGGLDLAWALINTVEFLYRH